MARNRSPQTQEKRRRERDKQMKRQEKQAQRHVRNATKREAKRAADAGEVVPPTDATAESPIEPGTVAPTIAAPKEPERGVEIPREP